jgi:hypothetical protein
MWPRGLTTLHNPRSFERMPKRKPRSKSPVAIPQAITDKLARTPARAAAQRSTQPQPRAEGHSRPAPMRHQGR